MDVTLTQVVLVSAGVIVFLKLLEYAAIRFLRSMIEIEKLRVRVYVEPMGEQDTDLLMLFNVDGDTFITQGNSNEIKSYIVEKFKNKNVYLRLADKGKEILIKPAVLP